ncbi:hypothetical protein ACP70R_008818 [Stipagrostis hirtigluma subsp. patula]
MVAALWPPSHPRATASVTSASDPEERARQIEGEAMAAVLDALTPDVKQMAKDMVEGELRMLLGVSSGIKKLQDDAGYFERYMADAERRRIEDASIKGWVSKLKDALYEATDTLELCQLHAEERQQLGPEDCWTVIEEKAPGFLRPLLFCLRDPCFAHGMGGRLKKLNEMFDEIRKEMVELRLNPVDSCPVLMPPSEATPPSHQTTSFLESVVVGAAIESDTRALVQELLTDESEIKVVSIVGPGGMGKSTLAKKIFNDERIQEQFKIKIWISVTTRYEGEKLLISAITQSGGGNDPRGDKQILTQALVDTLSLPRGKFLLVMDDVWTKGPWDGSLKDPIIKAASNQPRSRVIITTRQKDLVKEMGTAYHYHHVKPLCDDDAWSLLKKQLPQDVDLDYLEHIGMKVVRKCDGLPLAVKVVGGLLRTMKITDERVWQSVSEEPIWSADKKHNELNSSLRLSYDHLSARSKQCFLYYSLFPKGLVLLNNDVIGMWMSEGFLEESPGDKRRWKKVEDHYNDLIVRNLIEPAVEIAGDGSVCKMHDVIRSFAHKIAEEELLVVGPGNISSQLVTSTRVRQLSIESTESDSPSMVLPEWSSISENHELLRSLIIDGRIKFDASTTNPSLSSFPSLRVLLVRQAETQRFLETLCNLRHLKFLHLDGTDISRLPDDIDKLRFLQHIGLENCRNFAGELPTNILKLQRLTSFKVHATKFVVPKGFGGLTGLRTLSRFPVQVDGDWCSLQELGPLSELTRLEVRGLAAAPSSELAAKARIHDKAQLIVLVLMCYNPPEDEISISDVKQEDCQRMEEVFDQLCPPRLLRDLVIKDYMGRRPPSWMCRSMIAAIKFNSLTTLAMDSLPLCTQLPDGLCWLPSLERLYIDTAWSIKRVGQEFQGTSGGKSFPRLQFLRLRDLPEWEEWEWEEGLGCSRGSQDRIAMPELQQFGIVGCKLSRLPPGLASSSRSNLTELGLVDVPRITAVENFPSVVKLDLCSCQRLKIIRGFPRLQIACINYCPVLELLEAGRALDTVYLIDPIMVTLPEYIWSLRPRIFNLFCHPKLAKLLSSEYYLTELKKICEKFQAEPCALHSPDKEKAQHPLLHENNRSRRLVHLDFTQQYGVQYYASHHWTTDE